MPEHGIAIVAEDDRAALELVRELFAEYHEWLGQSVCSLRLAEEIANLPGPYAKPAGRLYLARDAGDGTALGCVGVRPHSGDACEIKRLYVRDQARGSGLGSALLGSALEAAGELGYRRALITTLPHSMPVARAMYVRAGFAPTEPFADHSHVQEGTTMEYLALEL